MKKTITIQDGTSKSQLIKAIMNYENRVNTTVLTFFVHENHVFTLVEFDGFNVTKWEGIVDGFINDNITTQLEGKCYTTTMTLVDIF